MRYARLLRGNVPAVLDEYDYRFELGKAKMLREAKRSGRLVVAAENHMVIGGLGEAVGAALMRAGVSCHFRQVGLPSSTRGRPMFAGFRPASAE